MYPLSPSPSIATKDATHAFWHQAFTPEEIDKILRIGNSVPSKNSIISGGEIQTIIRDSKNSWIGHNSESDFIYSKLAYMARQLNGEFF
jgi:hypothetical protein